MKLKKVNKGFFFLLFISMVLAGQVEMALGQDKVKIGISVWSGFPDSVDGFKAGLKEMGYEEGKNVEYVFRQSGIDQVKQQEIANELKSMNLDLVYSLTTVGTGILQKTLPQTTPIVFSVVTYPDKVGFVNSFENSGTNMVGTSNLVKPNYLVQIIKEQLKNVKKVAVCRRKNEPNSAIFSNKLKEELKKSGIDFSDDLVADTKEELLDLAKKNRKNYDALISATDTLMQGGGEDILVPYSIEEKFPIVTPNYKGVLGGIALGAVVSFKTLGLMSGKIAGKILKNKMKPPFALATEIQDPPIFAGNKDSIKKIGLKVNESSLTFLP